MIDVAERQRTPCNTALAMVLGVQVKDAPYVALATQTEWYHRNPRILTNDEAFAALDPVAHNLPNISVEYIPNESEDIPSLMCSSSSERAGTHCRSTSTRWGVVSIDSRTGSLSTAPTHC